MKKLLLLLHFTFCVFYFGVGQTAPGIEWQRCYGGANIEEAYDSKQTSDGGYILAGFNSGVGGNVTQNYGMFDYWIVKVDSVGGIQWQKSLGGSSNEWVNSISETFDNGYIAVGACGSNDSIVTGNHGYNDCWVVKLDNNGLLQWQKSFGGSEFDIGTGVLQTQDMGYVISGYTRSNDGDVSGNHNNTGATFDFWIFKIDSTANLQWQKCLGGFDDDEPYSIIKAINGGYTIAGRSKSTNYDVTGNHGAHDFWIVHIDSIGNLLWQKSLGGTQHDYAYSIKQTSDFGYIIAGHTLSNNADVSGNHGSLDFWLTKLDSSGNLQSQKCAGGSNFDEAFAINVTSDMGFIVAGQTMSNDSDVTGNLGQKDFWVVKFDSTLNLQWQKCLGGTAVEVAYSVQEAIDGGYIVAGFTNSNDLDVDGNHGSDDFWLVKLYPDTITSITNPTASTLGLQIFPNPVTNELTINLNYPNYHNTPITFSVTDIMGKQIFTTSITTSNHKLQTLNLPAGVYFVKVNSEVKKIIKIK